MRHLAAILLGVCLASPARAVVSVDPSTQHQTIDGFGVNFAAVPLLTPPQMTALFDARSGAGLSWVRLAMFQEGGGAIDLVQNTWGMSPVVLIRQKDAAIYVRQNFPEVKFIVSGFDCSGLPQNTGSFTTLASYLSSFVTEANAAGIPIEAVGPVNEPQAGAWGAWLSSGGHIDEMYSTVADGVLAAHPTVRMIAPEPPDLSFMPTWWGAISAPTKAKYAVAAFHGYPDFNVEGQPYPPRAVVNYTALASVDIGSRPLWQLEHCDTQDWDGASIATAIIYARNIHNNLTQANVSAWYYWAAQNPGALDGTTDNNNALIRGAASPSPGEISKTLWAMGQFSRFVRPGARRVAVSGAPSGVSISAYTAGGKLSVVAINDNAAPVDLSVTVTDGLSRSFTPYITDATRNLAAQGSVEAAGGAVTYTLPAKSIVTLAPPPEPSPVFPLKDRAGQAVTLKDRSGAAVALKGRN